MSNKNDDEKIREEIREEIKALIVFAFAAFCFLLIYLTHDFKVEITHQSINENVEQIKAK